MSDAACCNKFESCELDCISRLHWHDKRRSALSEKLPLDAQWCMDAFWRVNPGRNATVPSLYLLDFAREVLRVYGAAPSATATSKWISCGDRLPGNYATVLIADGDGIRSTGYWTGKRWYVDVQHPADPEITPLNWTPLPEAPK